MALPAIDLQNISITFKNQSNVTLQASVLENISLKVNQNDRYVLVGPSGHGKSILLKIIAGLIQPTHGQALVYGENLYETTPSKRKEILSKIGMLFQKNALFDSMTNFENIAFPLREVTEMNENQITENVEKYLDAVGLLQAKDQYPSQISGGMQKRLGLARALALRPKILLCDDPTAGLDPITSRMIVELILKISKEENMTVVAVANEMNRALQLATHIALVVNQGLINAGTPTQTQASTNPIVNQFMKGLIAGPLTEITD